MWGFIYNLWLWLAIASISVYWLLKERYKYFKKRGIPYVEPVFLFGSMPKMTLLQESVLQGFQKLYRSGPKDAPMVGFFQLHQPTYLIRDPVLVQRVLIKDFSHFHDRGFPIDEETNPLEGHLFNMAGTKWRALRNKLIPTFTSGKLKGMLPLMDAIVDQLIEVLDTQVGEEIEMRDTFARLTTDIIGSCTFGIDSGAIQNPKSKFRLMGDQIFRPTFVPFCKQMLRFLIPSLGLKLKLKVIPDDVNEFFFSVTKQSMDHRIKTGERRNDFLQLLLELKQKGEVRTDTAELKDEDDQYLYHEVSSHLLEDTGKLVLDDKVLTAQAFVFLVAGFETSATGLAFVAYLLSKHPDVQEKLRQEVKEIVAKHGGFSYDAIKAMPYLAACINEGLRIYPPFGILGRACNRELVLEDGTKIEKGASLVIPTAAIMRDEAYFPNPEEYRPERFLERDPIPGTFIPFGDGPRVCIAQRFAQLELKLALARMVDRYRIETCPKMAAQEPIELVPSAFIPTAKGGIFCRLTRLPMDSSSG